MHAARTGRWKSKHRVIPKSGRQRFTLDEEQVEAILELKLYRLARLEILVIREELDEKRKRVRQIGSLLKDEDLSRYIL